MTSIENARDYLNSLEFKPIPNNKVTQEFISNHSKHIIRQVISFLEANEKKPIKSIINELKGKV